MASVCMKCGEPHPVYITCEDHEKKPPPKQKTERVSNKTQSYDPSASERAKRWRENNPDKHREYMREYMKNYRRNRNA